MGLLGLASESGLDSLRPKRSYYSEIERRTAIDGHTFRLYYDREESVEAQSRRGERYRQCKRESAFEVFEAHGGKISAELK